MNDAKNNDNSNSQDLKSFNSNPLPTNVVDIEKLRQFLRNRQDNNQSTANLEMDNNHQEPFNVARLIYSDKRFEIFIKNLRKENIEIITESPLVIKTVNLDTDEVFIHKLFYQYFNAAEVDLKYKILEKKKRFFGFAKSECTLEYHLQEKKSDVVDLEILEDSFLERNVEQEVIKEELKPIQKAELKKQRYINDAKQKIESAKERYFDKQIHFKKEEKGIYVRIRKEEDQNDVLNYHTVIELMNLLNIKKYDAEILKQALKEKKFEWVQIYKNVKADFSELMEAKFSIELSPDKFLAYLTIDHPKDYEYLPSLESIQSKIKTFNIVYGILEDNIREILDYLIFDIPILIAIGDFPMDSIPSQWEFLFGEEEGSKKFQFQEGSSSKVDFYGSHGIIDSVVEEQVIAEKIDGFEGKEGKNLLGEVINFKQKDKDHELQLGDNVILSPNGRQIVSKIVGRPILNENRINVYSFYEIKGNVNLETGSITFLGDIFIRGSIEDGFSVKASGSIYVGGFIGKSNVESGGDIIVKGGIIGRKEVSIKAAKNVYAKFIEKANIDTNQGVIANEGVLYSQVNAQYVISLGKRGILNGGQIRCRDYVYAKVIGSPIANETKVEVGFDPYIRKELTKLQRLNKDLQKELNVNQLNLSILLAKKKDGVLDDKKNLLLEKLTISEQELKSEIEKNKQKIFLIKDNLITSSTQVHVSVADKIYPGVEITIQNTTIKLSQEKSYARFYLDMQNEKIETGQYQEYKGKVQPSNLFFQSKKLKGKTNED